MCRFPIYSRLCAVLIALGVACGCSSSSGSNNDGSSGSSGGDSGSVPSNVSSCGSGALFSTSPIALADLGSTYGIIPLGNLNPPGHTFPTAHLYFYLKDSDATVSGVDNVPLYAPGDLVITAIATSSEEATGKTDYSITFYPCSETQGYFGHVATLEGALNTAFSASSTSCTTYNPGSGNYTRCSAEVNVTVTAGEQIGTAGGTSTSSNALDFGLYDSRVTALVFANDERISANSNKLDLFHIVCAIDYYSGSTKTDLEAKLNRTAGATPLCGSYDQDVAETAQGKWFESSAASPYTTESGNLALVHDNTKPALGIFSVGNSTIGTGTATFTPTNSGTTNRDFDEVTSDGNIYCYDTLSSTGVIFLVQMPSATSLKLEKQTASACPASPAFTSSAITFVR